MHTGVAEEVQGEGEGTQEAEEEEEGVAGEAMQEAMQAAMMEAGAGRMMGDEGATAAAVGAGAVEGTLQAARATAQPRGRDREGLLPVSGGPWSTGRDRRGDGRMMMQRLLDGMQAGQMTGTGMKACVAKAQEAVEGEGEKRRMRITLGGSEGGKRRMTRLAWTQRHEQLRLLVPYEAAYETVLHSWVELRCASIADACGRTQQIHFRGYTSNRRVEAPCAAVLA